MNLAGARASAIYRGVLILWLGLLQFSGSAAAYDAPAHIRTELPDARLCGSGEFTWFGLKIYEAKLWTDNGVSPIGSRSNAKFALDLRYERDLKGRRIADASLREMGRMGIGSPQQHQAWLATMKKTFPDVKEGTHLTGVFLPDEGARFYLNGNFLGEVPDPEFARAFFAIWLDPKTRDKKLRSALLAESSRR